MSEKDKLSRESFLVKIVRNSQIWYIIDNEIIKFSLMQKEKSQEIRMTNYTDGVALKSLNNFPGKRIRNRRKEKALNQFLTRKMRSGCWAWGIVRSLRGPFLFAMSNILTCPRWEWLLYIIEWGCGREELNNIYLGFLHTSDLLFEIYWSGK